MHRNALENMVQISRQNRIERFGQQWILCQTLIEMNPITVQRNGPIGDAQLPWEKSPNSTDVRV